jgi:hypothetical protein
MSGPCCGQGEEAKPVGALRISFMSRRRLVLNDLLWGRERCDSHEAPSAGRAIGILWRSADGLAIVREPWAPSMPFAARFTTTSLAKSSCATLR